MKYATPYDEKSMARSAGIALKISTKKAVELCNFVRGRRLPDAMRMLNDVVGERIAVPFRRYAKGGTGHKPGIGPGRYPKNVCAEVVKLLKQAEANARNRGLDSASLVVKNILAKKGPMAWHFGRQRRRRMKSTHVEVVVMESKQQQEPMKGKSEAKKKEAAATMKIEKKNEISKGAGK